MKHSSDRIFSRILLAHTPQTEVESKLNWVGKRAAVERWLTYLKREIDALDLWSALAQERELLDTEPAGAINAPFNAEEQAQIKRAID